MRSIIILFALAIAAGGAVGQDADDLRTVIPRLHGQPEMVRNIAGQWEAAAIVYQDADLELSVPTYLLDGELAVNAIANAPLPLPWDGKGGYMVALYSFYKTVHGCVLDLQAAKLDLPENRAKCAGIRYQQRFLTIDPQNRTVTEASYMFMGANGLAHLASAWPRTTYPLDGPLINAHVTMLRKAIGRLQPLADRHAAANATTQSDYQKMWEQSRQIARESVTPSSQGGSILQETPEMRARMEQLQPQLQERAVRDQVDGQRWTCGASGYTKQECETRFPYPSSAPSSPSSAPPSQIAQLPQHNPSHSGCGASDDPSRCDPDDGRIKRDVIHAIVKQKVLNGLTIYVATNNREVTLMGEVFSLSAYNLAASVASSVPGVVAVHNNLKIAP
jgi:hypothetical protein